MGNLVDLVPLSPDQVYVWWRGQVWLLLLLLLGAACL